MSDTPKTSDLLASPGTSSDPMNNELRGAEFLEMLEGKHDQVLNELNELNERIEQVLQSYTASRSGGSQLNQTTAPGR